MKRALCFRDVVNTLASCALVCVACTPVQPDNTLVVSGTLERDGITSGSANGNVSVPVAYESVATHGEWWPCDLNVTAGACIGGKHVNVYVSLPEITDLDHLGGSTCVNNGVPFGAFEILQQKAIDHVTVTLPGDVSLFVVVASDDDGNGFANLDNDAETAAASRITEGTLTLSQMNTFNDPIAFTLDGRTAGGHTVHLEVQGPTAPVAQVPPLDKPLTCVQDDSRTLNK